MSRILGLARAAALLLVVPLVTTTVGALPAAQAVAAPAVSARADVDTDGDGLDDTRDGCPTVASSNPTGCPTAARRASLTYLTGRNRLRAVITSPVRSCASHARLSLWRVRPRGDVKVVGVEATARGRATIRVRRGSTYYLTVSPSYSSHIAECDRASSRKVRVPRS